VGDDSENPDTLKYLKSYALPFASENKILLEEAIRYDNGLTLYQKVMSDIEEIPLPMRYGSGGFLWRNCTSDYKIYCISKYIKLRFETRRFITGLGISTEEIHRAKTTEWYFDKKRWVWEKREYPLIDLGLNRSDCVKIIGDAGLPVPPKSSCYFCPYHNPVDWIELKESKPDLFNKAIEIEQFINRKRVSVFQKDKIWMHERLMPLDQAVNIQGHFFDKLEVCESGYCMV
jgi:hypothetical protein